MLCVSPYPHHLKERPTNPVLFWLGAFDGRGFDLPSADGAGPLEPETHTQTDSMITSSHSCR